MSGIEGLSDRLARMIAGGGLPDDGRLPPERDLAQRFGVTRNRLRQALDLLEARGAIYRRQGRGTFATPPTHGGRGPLGRLAREVTPQDLMEVRLEIEPALAAHAATRASKDEIARLERFMLKTLGIDDPATYEAADEVFHYHIALSARNPLFLELFDSIRTVRKLTTWNASRRDSHTPDVMARFGAQHRTLFEAIAARDAPEAAHRMELHLFDVNRALVHDGARSVQVTGPI